MNDSLRGRDLINLRDLSAGQLRGLIDLAWTLKAQKRSQVLGATPSLRPLNVVGFFEHSSLRTRAAMATACHDLGLGLTCLSEAELGPLETPRDVMRVLNGFFDLAVAGTRRPEQYLYETANVCAIPVVCAASADDRPVHMLAAALTMEEQWGGPGSSRGRKAVFVGNAARVPLYYGRLCALLGMDFYVLAPALPSRQLGPDMLDELQDCYERFAPGRVLRCSNDLDLLTGADVLITTTWHTATPEEATGEHAPDSYTDWLGDASALRPYQVNSALCARTGNPDLFLLHDLPALHCGRQRVGRELMAEAAQSDAAQLISDGMEVTDECFERFAPAIFRQVENRQHALKAILCAVLGI